MAHGSMLLTIAASKYESLPSSARQCVEETVQKQRDRQKVKQGPRFSKYFA